MSGHWEVVGKKREKNNKYIDQKIGKAVNEKKTENVNVKVEDVLTKSQVKNLYSNDKNKENRPLEKKVSEQGFKKIQKKQEKIQEVQKPKPPKSVESALNQIDVEEFKHIFEKSQLQFPDAPIVWLKELAQFLNQKISVDLQDPTFGGKPHKFPFVVVPAGVKSVIEKATKDAKKPNIQLFFDIALTAMATDMSKNLPALGHKLLLQNIALAEPYLISQNLSKHVILRNSYQNRPNIGLSILWALGQAGSNNFQVGLTVFQELMLPLIELKNYSRYIFKYLIDLITNTTEFTLTKEQFLLILDTIFVVKKNVPHDLKEDLISILPVVKKSVSNNEADSVDFYLRKFNGNNLYQEHLCDAVVEYFNKDKNSLENWRNIYAKNIASSAILLTYLNNNWWTVSRKLNSSEFLHTLNEISNTNEELVLKKKNEKGLSEITNTVQALFEKMASKKKSRSSFRLLFFIVSLTLAAFVYYDVSQEGSWQKSNTRRVWKNSGVPEYTHALFDKLKQGLWWIDSCIEENFPVYRKSALAFSAPYIELAKNLSIIACNVGVHVKEVILETFPIVAQSIESQIPGLVEQSQNTVNHVWSSSVLYFNRSVDYLKNEVFVGQLSPENMQKAVFDALNTTQHIASDYYHWLSEKVQTAIK